jgi:hypothetical protein
VSRQAVALSPIRSRTRGGADGGCHRLVMRAFRADLRVNVVVTAPGFVRSCATPPQGADAFGRSGSWATRGVAVVQHQRVAVGIGEEAHVADAGVERVGLKFDTALFEGRACRRDVVDV